MKVRSGWSAACCSFLIPFAFPPRSFPPASSSRPSPKRAPINNLLLVSEGGRGTWNFGPTPGNVFESNLFIGKHEGLSAGTAIGAIEP